MPAVRTVNVPIGLTSSEKPQPEPIPTTPSPTGPETYLNSGLGIFALFELHRRSACLGSASALGLPGYRQH